ncbi:MAG: hypothetical protein GY788_08725 [bacterium]|nr:hypothetical protein [bacterium]
MSDRYEYIEKRSVHETWEQLLLLADGDFVSFVLLSQAGKVEGTTLWMAAHSIEKYLKSWLLKADPDCSPTSYGHDLVKLWNEARTRFSSSPIFG